MTDAWVCELCHTEHPTPSIARDCRLRCETRMDDDDDGQSIGRGSDYA